MAGSVDVRTVLSYIYPVNGRQFIRKVRKAGRNAGVQVSFDQSRGKGSHGTLWYGDKFTVVSAHTTDIGPGLLHDMLRDLGLTRDDI